jgi:hypothetical protein
MLGTVTLLSEVLRRHLEDGDFEGLGPVAIPSTGGVHDAPDAVRLVLTAARSVKLRAERDESLDVADVTGLVEDLLSLEARLGVGVSSR